MSGSGQRIEDMLIRATQSLAGLSRCAGLMITTKQDSALKHVEFVAVAPGKALVIMVSEDGQVENRVIDTPVGLPVSALSEAGNYLGARLRGRTIDTARTEIIVPQAAHGTNPATAAMCGCTVKEIPCDKSGGIDIEALRGAVGPATAGIMLTNPSTLGVFEHRIIEVARIVHEAGGLLYYDGANLNAILGKVRPGDMGFDVIHMNLHKTFSTPHGGGGPGSGAVGVGPRLLPFLPIPLVGREEGRYRWLTEGDLPHSIGRLSGFMGNAGVNLRAYVYMRMLGRQGMVRVSEFAALNANYLMKRLTDAVTIAASAA